MRGKMVPPDVFDLALKERDAFRQRKAAESKTPAASPQSSTPARTQTPPK